jgi:NAD(P)-dependent dehydrogenase (short-subunit alcohol dehydrogenase family)
MTRTAIITGASRGLGKTLAELLAKQGAQLILTARGKHSLEQTAQALRAFSDTVIAIPGDIADPQHRARLVQAAEPFGRIDLLVNNASVLGPSPLPPLADFPLEAFHYLFDVNVFAPLGLVQESLPLLKKAGGLVVNISSDAAVGGYETWGPYGASKAALDLLSLTLANELSGTGVGVVSVDPGDMRTSMQQEAFPGEDISDRPLPEEMLPFWIWLLGQDPTAISGRRYQAQAERWELAAK